MFEDYTFLAFGKYHVFSYLNSAGEIKREVFQVSDLGILRVGDLEMTKNQNGKIGNFESWNYNGKLLTILYHVESKGVSIQLETID